MTRGLAPGFFILHPYALTMTFRFSSLLLFLTISTVGFSQKKPLAIDDFKHWKSLQKTQVSGNGRWVSYQLKPQLGNTRLVLHDLHKQRIDTLENIGKSEFAFYRHYLVSTVVPDYELIRALKLKKEKKENFPKDSLFVKDLKTGSYEFTSTVKSWKLPETNGQWLAYLSYPEELSTDSFISDSTAEDSVVKKKKQPKDYKDLVVRNLISGKEWKYPNVEKYVFSKNGGVCVFSTQDSAMGKGVHVFNTTNQTTQFLEVTGKQFTGLCVDTAGGQAAFIHSEKDKKEKKNDGFTLSAFNLKSGRLIAAIDSHKLQIRERVSPDRAPSFTKDGRRIRFGISMAARQFEEDTTILDEEKPKLDVWSYHDHRLQPEQLKKLDKDKKKSRLELFDISKKRILLTSGTLDITTTVSKEDQGSHALLFDSKPYQVERSWRSPWPKDVYLFDITKSTSTLFLKEFIGSITFSPQGKYLYWFDQSTSDWWIMSIKTGKKFSPSQQLGKIFHRADDDHPAPPPSYRIGGWLENDERIFINDAFGFWSIDPTNKSKPIRLGGDDESKEVWRVRRTDGTKKYLPTGQPILISVFNKKTKDSYYKVWPNINSDVSTQKGGNNGTFYSFQLQSKNKKTQLYTIYQSGKYPDIYQLVDGSYRRISDANPQQKQFKWYQTEIVEYVSADGIPLQGILYAPESYDKSKKYPLIVYFYEKLSDYVHGYQTPAPSRSTISRSFYCSNDYFVFVPDIVYKVGHPGKSAFNCIVPSVMQLVKDRPYIDQHRMALQGQSWGGYQTAYLITQTDLFSCAMAGAPVANMTSAYGGIRWGSGLNRAFQYEHGQSRIGGSLWEKPMEYLENSPLFYANQVNTPLLMMHNDNDGAVPWYQGIEYFTALRRLQKPVWMLVYNGEQHNLTKYPNQVDLSKRMFGFFNHYLKGEEAPLWMSKGIPALEKGKNWGY